MTALFVHELGLSKRENKREMKKQKSSIIKSS